MSDTKEALDEHRQMVFEWISRIQLDPIAYLEMTAKEPAQLNETEALIVQVLAADFVRIVIADKLQLLGPNK